MNDYRTFDQGPSALQTNDILKTVDLNLLVVFDELASSLHATNTAKRLGLSQPAVSHALNRLRVQFGDQLFIKTPKGMVPTPKAESLRPTVARLLREIADGIYMREDFDPFRSERTFRIGTTDLIEIQLLPTLVPIIEREAPGITVVFEPLRYELPKQALETGACDLAIAGFFGNLPDNFYKQTTSNETFLSCVRSQHPHKEKTWTLDDYCSYNHILVAPGSVLRGVIDEHLESKGKTRRVAVGVASFNSGIWGAASSDCILTAPGNLIRQYESLLQLRTFVPPVKTAVIKIDQVWHARHHQDPAHQWLREKIAYSLTTKPS